MIKVSNTYGPTLRALIQDGQLSKIERTWDDRISGAFLEHILENINFSEDLISQHIQGRVDIRFDVDSENNITNVQIHRSANPLLDNEVLAVFQSVPKISNEEMHLLRWHEFIITGGPRPAELANKRRFALPLNFVISEID